LINSVEINQTIYNFIKDKEGLNNIFNKISSFFDEETKNKYQKLIKNDKLNELKL
jgi:hypothetical protein